MRRAWWNCRDLARLWKRFCFLALQEINENADLAVQEW
jgi:hypothetical protein